MEQLDRITEIAKKNYEEAAPWPENDLWHTQTFTAIQTVVEKWLSEYSTTDMQILNAGSGGTEYETQGELFRLDIVEKYISQFEKHLVGSIEKIALPDSSMDGVICVGSVINYTDAQRAIAELSRVLKAGGFLILEYERSDSAEFLWTAQHSKYVFSQSYQYNGQTHLLWMYSEKHMRQMLEHYQFVIRDQKRLHILSSLLYRMGVPEERAARYAKYDQFFQPFSRPIAHNQILLAMKKFAPK